VGSTLNNKSLTILADRVRSTIRSRRLLKKGTTVVVGVSGGPDSVALLHILWSLRYELGIKLIAAHFNHRLRRAADGDQKFVERLAVKLNIPFVSGRSKTRQRQGSLEDWARRERFEFFAAVVRKHRAQSVALAHTQNDLAETVLMRLLRGTGLLGLRGILPERRINGVCFIRPLLDLSKDDLLDYLKANRLSYRNDHTNLKTDFFRNKIRLKLLPLLKDDYNANIRRVLADVADSVSLDYEFLREEAERIWGSIGRRRGGAVRLDRKKLGDVHPALRRMVLRSAFERTKGDLKRLTLDHIRDIEDLSDHRPDGAVVDLPGGISVFKTGSFLEFKTT
jgi:tRNA(Ile)-lysidine synthase